MISGTVPVITGQRGQNHYPDSGDWFCWSHDRLSARALAMEEMENVNGGYFHRKVLVGRGKC